MNDTWLKIKIWTKLCIIALVLIFVALFIFENISTTATVWIFKTYSPNVLELLGITFLLGVIATLLAKPTYHTLHQIKQLRAPKPVAEPPPTPPAPEPEPAAKPQP